mmetsp:Transcript_24265/g.69552  ORF Transcript_24265/g.69552 Transcript_24265/m.69552 type:complete len:367 (+) Transcript_24265:206-1306(+)
MNRSPSKASACAKPQLPRKLLTQPLRMEPTALAGLRPPSAPGALGGAPSAGWPSVPSITGRGERERASARPRATLGADTGAPFGVAGRVVLPDPSTFTLTASKPVCDLFPALRCTVNSTLSPSLRGTVKWGLLRIPTKRSPGYLCDVTKPQVSWKLRTRPEHWRPTRSLSSVGTACTLVAWHLPLEPSEISKLIGSPAFNAPRPGFEPWCRNKSPSKSSETTKPQPSRKLRTTPPARRPTKDSGPGFGAAKPTTGSVLGSAVRGAVAVRVGVSRGCWTVSPSCFTCTACMPLLDFSSRAIWNSTHLPCCRPFMPICGLALTPTKTSPSKRLELRRPQLSLKLLTQPRTVAPTRLCTSSFIRTAPTA